MKVPIILILLVCILPIVQCSTINNWHVIKPFDRIVIWGHTVRGASQHFWIHWGLWRAFLSLGYDTIWFDSNSSLEGIDFSNNLFITEGQDDDGIPLLSDCRYVLNNCDPTKYQSLIDDGDCIFWEVFTNAAFSSTATAVTSYVYTDTASLTIYMPWATDALPAEVKNAKRAAEVILKDSPTIYWITNLGDPTNDLTATLTTFQAAAATHNIDFQIENGSNIRVNLEKTEASYFVPTLVNDTDSANGYIPSRVFKNLSLGRMAITNSPAVYNLFNQAVIYNPDPYQLFFDAESICETLDIQVLHDLMDIVQKNHTYWDRVNHLFDFMNEIKPLITP